MSTVTSYVQQRDGEFYVGDSRVTVQTLAVNWKRGASPEEIQAAFPSLSLVAIYGTITYYLEHQDALDAHFGETEELLAAHQATVEAQRPAFFAELRARLTAHRTQRGEPRSDEPDEPEQPRP